ncbi:MAG: TlyA family RNA methyltransferase [Promethearchaeota archaeon]
MKERLDVLLVDRRLVESRIKAQWLIKNGHVLVNDVKITKPGKLVNNTNKIHLIKEFPYVGRGGIKLEAALKNFNISVRGKVCADIGASIGGFTDCLLKHDAQKVYAIDIATDFLHPSLLCEKMKTKVIPLLGVDIRHLEHLEELVDIVVMDITFTSVKDILPKALHFIKNDGCLITLIKPVFETEFLKESKLRIIKDTEKLREILLDIIDWSKKREIYPHNLMKSPIKGAGGSMEFFILFTKMKAEIITNIVDEIFD